jgi:small-conductance mechanosensitive channel
MQESGSLLRKLSIPATLSVALAVVYVSVRSLSPAWMDQRSQVYLLAALTGSAGVLAQRLVNFILLDLIFLKRKGRQAPQLLRMVVSIIGYSAIFVTIYSGVLDKSLSGVLATSAVLTVILGLALQDTLGNFFAGISLHIEQPYQIGDALRVSEVVGKVESVTWRTTTVRTNNNSLVVLPNSKVARDPIEVYSLNSLSRRVLRFPAPYSVRPASIIRMATQVAASTPKVSADKSPVVRIHVGA